MVDYSREYRLAQARTGTGKTLAFLIPCLQKIISNDPTLAERNAAASRRRAPDIRALIISPTRELAEQIAAEARRVVRRTGIIVQTAVGGVNKMEGLRKVQFEGCHVLVATPGRLKDILQDPRSRISVPNLQALVLDEADRLLDQGFLDEILQIHDLFPDRQKVDRQTMMFSATVPKGVMGMVNRLMKPDYKFVQTIQPGEADTHLKVPQKVVRLAGLENQLPAVLEICKRQMASTDSDMPFKAMVFFSATAEASLACRTFEGLAAGSDRRDSNELGSMVMLEIHSRLTQQQRTRAADTFRRAKTGILFSSDVAARGMDFPNVTHVIQVGLPPGRDTYVHRLGRTARGEKKGEGWLLLTPPEAREARIRLRNLPLEVDNSLETASVDMSKSSQLPAQIADMFKQVMSAALAVEFKYKAQAYRATLGLYAYIRDKQQLIDMMNHRSKYGWGLRTPPGLSPLLAKKMNVDRCEGVVFHQPNFEESGGPRRFGGALGSSNGGSNGRGSTGRSNYGSGGSGGDYSSSYSRGGGGGGGGGDYSSGYSRGGSGGNSRRYAGGRENRSEGY